MRIVKVIAIMFFGPVLGILVGFVVGIIAMPTQTAGAGRAPGDGFLIMGCVALGLLISIPVSAVLAGKLWSAQLRPKKQIDQNSPLPSRGDALTLSPWDR